MSKTTRRYTELVMDEYSGQPAYYGQMHPVYSVPIRENIDRELDRLNAAGLSPTVDHRQYGCSQ